MTTKTPNSSNSDAALAGVHEATTASRRDFLTMAAGGMCALGAGVALVPFVDSMNPAADTLAAASIEVDISKVQPGQGMTVSWRGKPVFIRRRTPEEIAEAEKASLADLKDPQADNVCRWGLSRPRLVGSIRAGSAPAMGRPMTPLAVFVRVPPPPTLRFLPIILSAIR